jgi:ABC-type transport system involved in cytochrome c biogenesis permease subunit
VAQIDHDIWEVVRDYFRTYIATIPVSVFFPRAWEVPGYIWFPGGFTIGTVMLANLLAAHAIRFKSHARGPRLLAGLALVAAGAAVTWGVVMSGSNKEGIEGAPSLSWDELWLCYKLGLLASGVGLGAWAASIERSRKLERFLLAGLGLAFTTSAVGLFIGGSDASLSPSSMRILWQLTKGWLAGLVLLAGCVLLFRKRAGVVLLHAGVGLMMLNEVLVYSLHEEAQMRIREGQTINYVQDIRQLELAVIDRSGSDQDEVVAIPQARLVSDEGKPRGTVDDAKLPFDVRVRKFIKNTNAPRAVKPGEDNPATAGAGRTMIVDEVRASSGTDTGGRVDFSAAYVEFLDRDDSTKSRGTHLLSLWQGDEAPEHVTVGDKTYDVYLRHKRIYKPYAMRLNDVRFDRYIGTDTPMNYSSTLRLIDPTRNVDREVKIWMNNPLRFAGETFYQSSVDPDERGTGLQVVSNTGWMLPYVACMIVLTGMLAHFMIVLGRFLRRSGSGRTLAAAATAIGVGGIAGPVTAVAMVATRGRKKPPVPQPLHPLVRFAPLMLVGLCGAMLAARALPPRAKEGEMDLYRLGELPVIYQGRPKPFDSLARNTLRKISKREYFVEEVDGEERRRPAIVWLLDTITEQPAARKHKVFRIENLDLLSTLGLKRRQGYRYAIEEFRDRLEAFDEQVRLARETSEGNLSVYQRKVLELNSHLGLYSVLLSAFRLPAIGREETAKDLLAAVKDQQRLVEAHPPLAAPPTTEKGEWQPYTVAWTRAFAQVNLLGQKADPATVQLAEILSDYMAGRANKFNAHVAAYRELLEREPYRGRLAQEGSKKVDLNRVRFEAYYNYLSPLSTSMWLYTLVFILTACGWLGWPQLFHRSAFALLLFVLAIHSAAIVGRIYISGRPPVTNLYSAAVFIAWGAALFGRALEIFSRLGIGNAIGAIGGFTMLAIASFLGGDGDTFTVLQAVLDTQFWLTTHVTCVTLGYTATYVAGMLGLVYVLAGLVSPAMAGQTGKEVARMIYGILCFAILFSFYGTVLGGLWADDSWGRFWGWDPKENGAMIIVLWNALVIHARWDGMIKDRGLALLAVAGNITVSWSMFGVNELGAGLHSYGFTEGIALALMVFAASQLAVIAAGSLLPQRLWRSFRPA